MDEIYQAPIYKRIIAALLDVVTTLLLSIGLFMLLYNGAVDIGFHNLNYKIDQYKLQEQSSLFYVRKNNDGTFLEVSTLTYHDDVDEEYKIFLERINNYYFDYLEKSDKSQADFNKKYMQFEENSLKNPIFSINSINDNYSSYILLDEVTDVSNNKRVTKEDTKNYYTAIKNFFVDSSKGIYNLSLTEFTSGSRFQNIVNQLEIIERVEILICVAFSTLIFISLPVLINKNGETAFMHVLGICFTDSYGYKVKWRHKIIRAVVVLLLNTASAYLFGIPLAINGIIYLATPSKRSALDFASNETAIDKKTSVIIEE